MLRGERSGQDGPIAVRKLQIENRTRRRDRSARLARSRTLNRLRLANGEPLGDQASPERKAHQRRIVDEEDRRHEALPPRAAAP